MHGERISRSDRSELRVFASRRDRRRMPSSASDGSAAAACAAACRHRKRAPADSIAGAIRSSASWAISVEVTADVFRDGHDVARCGAALPREGRRTVATKRRLRPVGNDAWRAAFASSAMRRTSTRSKRGPTVRLVAQRRAPRSAQPRSRSTLDLSRRPRAGRRRAAACSGEDRRRLDDVLVAVRRSADADARADLLLAEATRGSRASAMPDRTLATRYAPALDGRSATGARRDSRRGTNCSCARTATTPGTRGTFADAARRLAGDPRDGLRRRLSRADPSDRPCVPQRPQQRAQRRARAIPAARGRSATSTAATPRSNRRWERSTTSTASSPPRARTISKSRSITRCNVRPTIRTSASIRSGSSNAPTARSPTPKIRPRSTRTSSTSIGTARTRAALWAELRDIVLFWIAHGVTIVPRRQSAHETVRLLGMDDRRRPVAPSRRRSSSPKRSRARK